MSVTLRRMLVGLLCLGLIGTGTELVLLGHTETALQLAPLILIAFILPIVVWHESAATRASLTVFRTAMIVLVAIGAAGIALHFKGNLAFQMEIDASQPAWTLFKKAIHATSPPALAPAAMSQFGLLGLIATYRHPASKRF